MSKSLEATRSALANRVHRFITVSERYKLNPTFWESYHVLSAIEHLKHDRYEDGMVAMARAEGRAAVPASAPPVPGHREGLTESDLRAAFRLVIRSEE